MTLTQIVFIITAGVMLVSAVMVVTSPKLLHAGLWLILTLLMVGVTYVLLENPFFGVVQLLVYIGAIAILIIFAVMLTRKVMFDDSSPFSKEKVIAAIAGVIVFALLVVIIQAFPGASLTAHGNIAPGQEGIAQLGQALVSPDQYMIPFEVASILLLAAMVGAIFIAREKKSE